MSRLWRNLITTSMLCTLFAGMLLSGGCSSSTRHRVLTFFFEDVPEPGQEVAPEPVIHQPRRAPGYKPKTKTVVVKIDPHQTEKTLFLIDWKGLLRKLPKDAVGGIDWVKALDEGDIAPKVALNADTPAQPVLYLDVHLQPPAQPLFKVTFPHKPHTEWLACSNCHPKIFHMQQGADPISMEKIFAGEYCGRCHGKVAFDVATGCPRCHRALAGPQ